MDTLTIHPIGKISARDGETAVILDPQYIPALAGLEGFGCVQVLWWFDKCDNPSDRSNLIERKPYTNGPDVVGAFATRTPMRPNPVALSTAYVTYIDSENGVVGLAYIDAEDGSPVIDLKPYTPSLDRVEQPEVPEWCAHWPKCCEDSGDFDWESEFNF